MSHVRLDNPTDMTDCMYGWMLFAICNL